MKPLVMAQLRAEMRAAPEPARISSGKGQT